MFTTRSRFITSPGITGCLSIQQVPILPTFLEQLFCTKVFCAKADHKMLVKLTFYEQIVCFKVFCSFSIIAISIIVLFGKKNISAKVACKMLVKLTTGVNFINILLATFAPIFFGNKIQGQNVTRENLRKALLYEKFVRKMLMKLTTGVNFVNILRGDFLH